jgi:hypothetical protein
MLKLLRKESAFFGRSFSNNGCFAKGKKEFSLAVAAAAQVARSARVRPHTGGQTLRFPEPLR